MTKTTQITCPRCGHPINVEDVLAHQIEEKYRLELNTKVSEIENDFRQKESSLVKKELELKEKSSQLEQQVAEKANEMVSAKEKELKEKIESDFESRIKAMAEETDEAKKKVKDLQGTQIENERLKRQMAEQKQTLELDFEKKLNERIDQESAAIRTRESERVEMKVKELEKKLSDQTILAEEMRRKAEQGSMQLQGEVQELALEEMLKATYPFDFIDGVPKGIRGADVIQRVRNKLGVETGVILYESKRTKAFSNDWISKLKSDAVLVKADICVIVTEKLPDGIDRIGQIDGVWICNFHDFKGLTLVLRESLLKISEAFSSQSNKGDKMQMLYDYLTGIEFRLQMGAIIEGFSDLQNSYIQERRAMERIWKQREKQLEKVLLNTNHFIGSIQGIAGSSIPELKQIGEVDDILKLEENSPEE